MPKNEERPMLLCEACGSYHVVPRTEEEHAALKCFAPFVFRCTGCGRPEEECSADPCEGVQRDRVATMPTRTRKKPLQIRTRYQRIHAAMLLAETLRSHGDPTVSNTAHEIATLLAAPGRTLNNVLDSFEPGSKAIIRRMLEKTPTAGDALLDTLRITRATSQALKGQPHRATDSWYCELQGCGKRWDDPIHTGVDKSNPPPRSRKQA